VRGSYDRAFQTPAFENLLLASSSAVDTLSEGVVRLPVRPSRGHFYEGGISKALFGAGRLDASYFERRMTNFADDDLLLNTGVGFPIAFRHGDIRGTEVKFDVPRWGAVSGSISYAWMRGVGALPITGGLFLDDDSTLVASTTEFAVSQDQRHTLRGQMNYQVNSSTWLAVATAYGSGLPFEFEGDAELAAAQFGERIVDRVDLETGRVRPFVSLDASASFALRNMSRRSLRLQFDVRNLTNGLNVINFAGMFSGTALAPPRSFAVRVRADF
jgi:hypothetical protein